MLILLGYEISKGHYKIEDGPEGDYNNRLLYLASNDSFDNNSVGFVPLKIPQKVKLEHLAKVFKCPTSDDAVNACLDSSLLCEIKLTDTIYKGSIITTGFHVIGNGLNEKTKNVNEPVNKGGGR